MDHSTQQLLDLSLVVPVYNEIGNLDALVNRVRDAVEPLGIEWELLAVDDASNDGSGERLDELAAAEQRIRRFPARPRPHDRDP
jgi:glycosyltransferase involved in cell wall biosynthesis